MIGGGSGTGGSEVIAAIQDPVGVEAEAEIGEEEAVAENETRGTDQLMISKLTVWL